MRSHSGPVARYTARGRDATDVTDMIMNLELLNPISIIVNRTAAGRPLRVGLRALGGRAVWPMAGGNGGGAPPRAPGRGVAG